MGFRFFLCSLLLFNGFYALAEQQTILVVESYHSAYTWDASYLAGLTSKLGGRFTIDHFEMDTKRIATHEFQSQADAAYKLIESSRPDLVVLGDDNAFIYLASRVDSLGIPIVYLGLNGDPYMMINKDLTVATGVLERPNLKQSIVVANRLMGDSLKKVLVLFDSGETSLGAALEEFRDQGPYRLDNVAIVPKYIGKASEWENVVLESKTKGYDAVFAGLYHTIKDDEGNYQDPEKLLAWTSEHSPLPLFGFWDFSIGANKAIGGYVLSGEKQGEAAGELILDILVKKVSPSSIKPVIGNEGKLMFSKSQLNKWQLTLPPEMAEEALLVD